MSERNRHRVFYGAFLFAIFAYLLVFFTQIHPIQIFDGDDWTYFSFSRDALPDAYAWNPTRIFPEIWMPVCGFLAAYIITPITGNYIFSMTAVSALAASAFILLYMHLFKRGFEKTFTLSKSQAAAIAMLFFLVHFWIFRSAPENNMHLFLARSATCYFYYTFPTLLNACLVLLFELHPTVWEKSGNGVKGLLFLAVYLAIFSNLFCSIVIVAYSGGILLLDVLYPAMREKSVSALQRKLKEKIPYLLIILLWLVSLGFELKGGRASSVGTGFSLQNIKTVLKLLLSVLGQMNPLFSRFAAAVILASILTWIVSRLRKPEDVLLLRKVLLYGLCAAATGIFLVLLCSMGSLINYISCPEVMLTILFYVLLALFACVSYLVKKCPTLEILLPLLICVVIFNCNTGGRTYQDANQYHKSAKTVGEITTNIYGQIMRAYENGNNEVTVYVPETGIVDNWPLPYYMGERMAATLCEHGQIDPTMTISFVPDNLKSAEFGLLK